MLDLSAFDTAVKPTRLVLMVPSLFHVVEQPDPNASKRLRSKKGPIKNTPKSPSASPDIRERINLYLSEIQASSTDLCSLLKARSMKIGGFNARVHSYYLGAIRHTVLARLGSSLPHDSCFGTYAGSINSERGYLQGTYAGSIKSYWIDLLQLSADAWNDLEPRDFVTAIKIAKTDRTVEVGSFKLTTPVEWFVHNPLATLTELTNSDFSKHLGRFDEDEEEDDE